MRCVRCSASLLSRRAHRVPLPQVCVFYLVLRGLDTVEDDMSIPEARGSVQPGMRLRRSRASHAQDVKIPALLAFHKSIYDRKFSAVRCGPRGARPRPADAPPSPKECGPATKGHYKELMTKFPLVRRCRYCDACLCVA